jgi:hypothetical protein
MNDHRTLKGSVECVMEESIATFFATIPFAQHLTDDAIALNNAYYVRHKIETVKRILMTARIDAMALARIIPLDYEAARKWAAYSVEEMNHDRLFLRDLARHGVTTKDVLAEPAFPATDALGALLESEIEAGRPYAAVAYSLFVEWNADRYSERAVTRAEKAFTQDHVRGARAHTQIDKQEAHYDMILGIADSILKASFQPEEILLHQLRRIGALLCEYFVELYEATVVLGARGQAVP